MNVTALVLVSWLAQAAGPAPAPDAAKSQAQALLKDGAQKYQRGAYEDALESFSRAYAIFHSPKILFNIGQAHRELGHALEAIYAFEKFVELCPDASPELIAEAKRAADEVAVVLGSLQIECPIAGADVEVDGKLVGRAPFTYPVRATIGPHRVTAIAPEHGRDEQVVNVRAGQVTSVVVKPTWATAPIDPTMVQAQAAPRGWMLGRKWTWIAAGSTVAFATGAIIAGLSMQSKFDDLRSSCGKGSADFKGCRSSDLDGLDTRRNLANVFWGLTAAAAVTTGALFYIEGRPLRVAPMAGSAVGLLVDARY